MSVETKITAVIKTFERQDKLQNLVNSIRDFYPNLSIIIIDDSQEPSSQIWDDHCRYIFTEYDIGLSEGRNRAVALVNTPYTLLLDDDYKFTKDTKINKFLEILDSTNFDLVGGDVVDFGVLTRFFRGYLKIKNYHLHMKNEPRPLKLDGFPQYDYVINFFLARTSLLRAHPWDPDLKIREHEVFFWRLKQNEALVTFTEKVKIDHFPGTSSEGNSEKYFHNRVLQLPSFHQLACLKLGVMNFTGEEDMYHDPWKITIFSYKVLKKIGTNKEKSGAWFILYQLYIFFKPLLKIMRKPFNP
ncbi:MAG: glycosyltransferase family 2 protein [Nitrospinales bacterium]